MGSSPIPATRPVGQAVKTPPFHGGNMGSIPVRVTKKGTGAHKCSCSFFADPSRTHFVRKAHDWVRISRPKIGKRLAQQGILQAVSVQIFAPRAKFPCVRELSCAQRTIGFAYLARRSESGLRSKTFSRRRACKYSRLARNSRNLIGLFKLPDKIVFDADRCDGSHLKVGDKIRGSYLKGTIDGNNVHVDSVGVITE